MAPRPRPGPGSGRAYAFIDLSDSTGSYEVTVFSKVLESSRELLQAGSSVVIAVEARMEDDNPKLMVNSVKSLQSVVANASAGLRIVVDNTEPFNEIQDILGTGKGGNGMVHLQLDLEDMKRVVEVTLLQRYAITPQIRDTLDTVPGIRDIIDI